MREMEIKEKFCWKMFWWIGICLMLTFFVFYLDWKRDQVFAKEKTFINSKEIVIYRVKSGDTLSAVVNWAMDQGYMNKDVDIRKNIYFLELRNQYVREGLSEGDIIKIPVTNPKKII